MNLEMLEKSRAKAWQKAKDFIEDKSDENGLLEESDVAEYEKMESLVKNYTAQIERLKDMEKVDEQLSRPINTPIVPIPDGVQNKGRASDAYKSDMLTALRTRFRNVSNVLQEGVDADGGYLVPEEYDSRLIDSLVEENVFRKLATTITTNGERKINIAGAKPAAAWLDEGAALAFDDAKFSQILLDAHKLAVAVKVTEELLYDNAFGLENYILDQFARALSNAEEDAFINGDGIKKPLGIFAATGGGEVGVTTSSATAISADELVNLVYSLKRPYRKNAAFIINDQTLGAIRKLKDGNGAFMWQPALVAGEPDRLLGYPVYTSAYVPTIASGANVIAFGDFSYYNIGDRGTRSFSELKELYAGNGMVGFVAKERVDGKLVLPEAVKILKMKGTSS